MAGAKEIRSKIHSVKNTQKITGAMQMVAASKMRKSQERMSNSRPYAEIMRKVIGHIRLGNLEYKHPYTLVREVKRVGYIVISTDRGLCGGLNINLFKKVIIEMRDWQQKGIESDIAVLGNKAIAFFNSFGGKVVAKTANLGDKTSVNDVIGTVQTMLDAFDSGKIDELYVCYNGFINTMAQSPKILQLLPLPEVESDIKTSSNWDYIYEADPKIVLDNLMYRYVESQVYQAVVENQASEQAARMVAMKAATDNAGNLIDALQLIYNKERQAAITQELSEICGGAAAV